MYNHCYMENCIFCKIISHEIPCYQVWEDTEFLAFLDIKPMNPGHLLLIPKVHVDYVFDVSDPLYSKMFQIAKKLATAVKLATNARKIGIVVEGISVPHVHIHLVPVFAMNDLSPERAKLATKEELESMQANIIKYV